MHQEHTQEDKPDPPDLTNVELSDVIDAVALQGMMDDYYALTGIGIGILDLKGKVLVGTGWQDICVNFHRVATESFKFCHDSDISLSINVPPGTFKSYRCKNNMWDIVTPIMLEDKHIGNIFLGQFLYNDEEPDYDLFRAQARRFGYDETAYIAALDRVPRYSRQTVQTAMCFYSKLARMISKANYSNVILANTMAGRVQAEEKLRESERQYSALFANRLNAIAHCRIITDEHGRPVDYLILKINEGYERIIGIKKGDIEGRRVKEVYPNIENYAFDYIGVLGRIALEGGEVMTEVFLDTTRQYLSLYAYTAVPGEFTAIFTDITERKQTEEELAQKQQQLAALNQYLESRISTAIAEMRLKDGMLIQQSRLASMGEMINYIAHQWRQPLNTMGLIVQNLLLSYEAGELAAEEMREEVASALDVILYMSNTIDDFRNLFGLEKELGVFIINQVVSRALNFVSPVLRSIGIKVELDEQPDISAKGYPNEFLQTILNIINNAKDVLQDRKGADPLISIRIFREDNRSIVTIRDNGGGIREDLLQMIFDPYFTTKEQDKGTGLGLHMAKVIIEKNMEGRLSVRNVDGGAEFRVEI